MSREFFFHKKILKQYYISIARGDELRIRIVTKPTHSMGVVSFTARVRKPEALT